MVQQYHTPVLVKEAVKYVFTKPNGIYVDGTLGSGGHAEHILKLLTRKGHLIGFDMDDEAITYSRRRLDPFANRTTLVHDNFVNMRFHLIQMGIQKIHGLLLDLGVSSHQIDDATRGFSFQNNSRLDMRMDRSKKLDAWTVVNTYEKERLAEIFLNYGEERHAKRIARAITEQRIKQAIETTGMLAQLIASTVKGTMVIKTLARIFQAIRIEVNRELENLERVLIDALDLLEPAGRIVVISYHSLEDRIVKRFFHDKAAKVTKSASKLLFDLPRLPKLRVITKKPVIASFQECKQNPRARSAKLRAAEKI